MAREAIRSVEKITRVRLPQDQVSASLARQEVETARDLLDGSLSRIVVDGVVVLCPLFMG